MNPTGPTPRAQNPPCLSGPPPDSQVHRFPMTPQDDEGELLCRVAAQDQQAFATLYARYAPRVCGYLVRRLSRADLVDDVLQEVMLVLWQRASRCPPTVPLVAWLYGIARRKAWKARSRTSVPTRPPAPAPAPAPQEAIDADDPERIMLRQEYGCRLAGALDTLPLHERLALLLLVQQGYSHQEIAARTNVPVSTVRTRVSRARQRLRARVAALDRGLFSPS